MFGRNAIVHQSIGQRRFRFFLGLGDFLVGKITSKLSPFNINGFYFVTFISETIWEMGILLGLPFDRPKENKRPP